MMTTYRTKLSLMSYMMNAINNEAKIYIYIIITSSTSNYEKYPHPLPSANTIIWHMDNDFKDKEKTESNALTMSILTNPKRSVQAVI